MKVVVNFSLNFLKAKPFLTVVESNLSKSDGISLSAVFILF